MNEQTQTAAPEEVQPGASAEETPAPPVSEAPSDGNNNLPIYVVVAVVVLAAIWYLFLR